MIALRIEFLAGRFHANPWDRGTNDGDVDWPPAPWRLLRAIVAGWYRDGQPDRDRFTELLDRLTEPPAYLLPRASTGHTRHYMPLGTLKKGNAEKTLVLDSFIALERDREHTASAYVLWPYADPTPEQRTLLERACRLIGYLGRAESWCSITACDAAPNDDRLTRVDLASGAAGDGLTVRRLAAGPSLRGEGLLQSLSETTAAMRKARRLVPAGTAWAEYRLPADFLMVSEQYDRTDRRPTTTESLLLRFALERGTHSPKPSIEDAIVFGELLRAALIRRLSDRQGEPATFRLAGKAEDGSKREGHDHPYFLAFDAEGRGEIDGVEVWFPRGCNHDEYLAVTTVPELRLHKRQGERIVYEDTFPLTFVGNIEPQTAQTWQSATPIALDRFPKLRGPRENRRLVDAPEEQIAAMIARTGKPAPRIDVWPPARGIEKTHGGHIRIDAFRRARARKATPSIPVAAATLHFEKPVTGPIILGRLAHFGLGRFEPADSD